MYTHSESYVHTIFIAAYFLKRHRHLSLKNIKSDMFHHSFSYQCHNILLKSLSFIANILKIMMNRKTKNTQKCVNEFLRYQLVALRIKKRRWNESVVSRTLRQYITSSNQTEHFFIDYFLR